jgi:hypothetical protein
MKLKHWRAFRGVFALKGSPVLEFDEEQCTVFVHGLRQALPPFLEEDRGGFWTMAMR